MLFQLHFDNRKLALGMVTFGGLIMELDLTSSDVDRNFSSEFAGIWLKP